MVKWINLILLFISAFISGNAQDIGLLNMHGYLPATYLNPGIALEKKFNLSLAGINVLIGTDGPAINQITSRNSSGQRYLDVNKLDNNLEAYHNIFFENDIHTLDLSFKVGGLVLMTGHAFRSSGNFRYPKGLIQIAAQGNAAFTGQTIEIAPFVDINAYNELYLGLQNSFGPLTVGIKGKLLYGVANVTTEKARIGFSTNEEFYQLQFDTDYLVRSSALFRYNSLDSITFDYSGLSFDNFFYNNRGFAFDIGASLNLGDKLSLSVGAVDIGKINWDFSPRKYTSQGSFSFDGVDVLEYLGDSTSISISDTLIDLLEVKQVFENYSTSLKATITLGATYTLNNVWSFNSLLLFQDNINSKRTTWSVSAVRKLSIFDLGLQYTVSKNNFSDIGLFAKINLGPVSAFASTNNIFGLLRPFDNKSAGVRLGAVLQL
ncbi:MAG: hypothetical protein H7X99_04040 [Saprospiraceae bacterium]|nr:hypothetical protein [Saprospiraceae bacterium]